MKNLLHYNFVLLEIVNLKLISSLLVWKTLIKNIQEYYNLQK